MSTKTPTHFVRIISEIGNHYQTCFSELNRLNFANHAKMAQG